MKLRIDKFIINTFQLSFKPLINICIFKPLTSVFSRSFLYRPEFEAFLFTYPNSFSILKHKIPQTSLIDPAHSQASLLPSPLPLYLSPQRQVCPPSTRPIRA